MKMVNKHGNVIINANTRVEQERLKNLGYKEFKSEENEQNYDKLSTGKCDGGKSEQSFESEKDNPVANNLKAIGFKKQKPLKKNSPKGRSL